MKKDRKTKTTGRVKKQPGNKFGFNKNKTIWFILGGIVVLTFVLYSNALKNEILTFDDNEYFTNYPEILNLSWKSVVDYFTKHYVLMYQPLPILTFAINYHFTKLDPLPLHLLNVLMHIVNVVLVFLLTEKISKNKTVTIIVTLLFALHPMNVEAVSWISARSSTMFSMFFLLALLMYTYYLESKLNFRYIVYAFLFFVLSLFSKAQAVTLPIVLFLFDYYYERRIFSKRVVIEKIPFLILSVIFGLIAISDKGTTDNITKGMMASYTLLDAFFLISYSFQFYFFRLFLPVNLSSVYVYPPKTGGYLPVEYYISPLIVLLVLLIIIYGIRKRKYVLFGVFWFLIIISINIQLIPSRLFIVTDRYVYLPYVGLFFIIGQLLTDTTIPYPRIVKRLFLLLAMFYLFFFSVIIVSRNKVWNNDLVFMTDIIEKNPKIPYLVRAYGNRANYRMNRQNYTEALSDFTSALEVAPNDAQTYYNRAMVYIKLSKFKEALTDLDKANGLNPKVGLILSNRAFVKYNLNDYRGAIEDADKAISTDPANANSYNIRAAILFQSGKFEVCEKDLKKAIQLNPNFIEAYRNLGQLCHTTGRKAEACEYWLKAIQLGDNQSAESFNRYCK